MTNQVNHPSHYNVKGKKECIVEIEESTSPEVVFDGCLFNIDKYMYRKGKKKGNPDLEDINKALWYCKYALNLVKNDKISKKDRLKWLLYDYEKVTDAVINSLIYFIEREEDEDEYI